MHSGSSDRSTTVEMIGGLGNNLFQLAAGLSVRERFGGEARFFSRFEWVGSEVEDLVGEIVHAGIDVVGREIVMGDSRRFLHRVRRRIVRELRFASGDLVWQRVPNPFQPMPDDLVEKLSPDSRLRSIHLWGFFQHPSWFEAGVRPVTERIWETLRPHAAPLIDIGATVISVRRGDYVPLGWDLPMDYYERALEALGPVDGPVWFVSDDSDVETMFAPLLAQFGLTSERPPALEICPIHRDLALLSAARSVVASNSTFCWWGVVTGQMQGNQSPKRVIAPTKWIPRQDSEVLPRADWIRIDHSKWIDDQASA